MWPSSLGVAAGFALIAIVLWDAFETVILPRRVIGRVRLARAFYFGTWNPWAAVARRIKSDQRRESFLSFYGPLSLILLLGVWAGGLIVGFALLHWGFGSHLVTPNGTTGFGVELYMSGTTLFTLGLGDVFPHTTVGRILAVAEGGTGFALLALVIGYLPILYQAFSRREGSIALLDARAGSPPCAAEMLRRFARDGTHTGLSGLLAEWERWAAELLESQLSYPLLAFYRSQHENQSWVASLTMVLDLCALVLAGAHTDDRGQARLTFAIARHAAVDLSNVVSLKPAEPSADRLTSGDLVRLRELLSEAGVPLDSGQISDQLVADLRRLYEPYVAALSTFLLMPLPPWLPPENALDDWLRTGEEESTALPG